MPGPKSSTGRGSRTPKGLSLATPRPATIVSCMLWQWSAPVGETEYPRPRALLSRGSCIGTSCPLTWTANSSAPSPSFSAALLVPSASRSPIPSRFPISSTSLTIASAFPKLRSMPPVISLVMMPSS